MAIVQIKGSNQKVRFPNDMIEDQMLTALRSQYPRTLSQNIGDALSKPESTISNRDVSLAENTKQKIANFLFDNKIVSDRYGAQRIGDNLSSLLGVLPGIGDAQAGDEFGRAVAEGDGFNMLAAGVGVIPVAGDVLKQTLRKAKSVSLPSGKLGADQFKIIKQSDPKAKTTVSADGSITASYLEEYQPKQIKGPLYEFEPDALELSEDTFKNTKTYKGDKDKPISVTKEAGDYKILDGHHRAKLAKEEGRNVKAIVIPIDDVATMKKDNIHQADMFSEWVARGLNKPEAKPLGNAAAKGARKVFHGSNQQIDEYMRGVNTRGRLGAGIYFGDEKKANVFAKMAKIKKQPSFLNQAEIVSDNPKQVTEDMLLLWPQGKFPAEVFEKEGYTGIQLINQNTGEIIEETVFDPKNIKSLNKPKPKKSSNQFKK